MQKRRKRYDVVSDYNGGSYYVSNSRIWLSDSR
nr:MAG TPA: hypothetical protein [Caudoviricetes sp.]